MQDYLFQDQSLSQTQPHYHCREQKISEFSSPFPTSSPPRKPQGLEPRPRPESPHFNGAFEPQGGGRQPQREASKPSHVRCTRPPPTTLDWGHPLVTEVAELLGCPCSKGLSWHSTSTCQVPPKGLSPPFPTYCQVRFVLSGPLGGDTSCSVRGGWGAPSSLQS